MINKMEHDNISSKENIKAHEYSTTVSRLKDLKVACIVDELTYYSYMPECILF